MSSICDIKRCHGGVMRCSRRSAACYRSNRDSVSPRSTPVFGDDDGFEDLVSLAVVSTVSAGSTDGVADGGASRSNNETWSGSLVDWGDFVVVSTGSTDDSGSADGSGSAD